MKCPSCGKYYDDITDKCPHCNATIIADFSKRERVALFLKRQLPGTRLALSNLSLILVVMINISVLALILNVIAYNTTDNKAVWCQYAICGLALVYIILKTFATNREKILSYTRNCTYLILIALNITQFVTVHSDFDSEKLWATYFITPIFLAFISVLAVCLALVKKVRSTSFFATITANALLSLYPLIYMLATHDKALSASAAANSAMLAGLIITWCILLNYLLLRFISLFTRVKRIF